MALVSLKSMLDNAEKQKYAIGYFESWNIESLQGVLDAAEQTQSPVILGFNGEFLSHPFRISRERLSLYAALGKAAAESASVPCGLIFNECAQDDWTKRAVHEGFNLVMPIDPKNNYKNYLSRTKEIVEIAHEKGAAVEAELGELPDWFVDGGGSNTDPDIAADFVEKTQVDLLAVSVGNTHKDMEGGKTLDFELLKVLQEKIKVPLVLHGGSGISGEAMRKAVSMGIRKVNYGTYLKKAYLKALREALNGQCDDPHYVLGYGGKEDLMVIVRKAICNAVLTRIQYLGCCGKA